MDDILTQLGINNTSADFDKQDVLSLLSTGLKENQSFAKHFADTVLTEIQRKLKNINIQSSAIMIDGEAISKDINDQIKEGTQKAIRDTTKKVETTLKTATDVTPKTTKDPLSISSLLGIAPQMSIKTSARYQGMIRKLLDKIENSIPKDNLSFSAVSIGDLIRPMGNTSAALMAPRQSVATYEEWTGMQRALMSKIRDAMPVSPLSFKEISLSDIYSPPHMSGVISKTSRFLRYLEWDKLQHQLINKLSKAVKKVTFVFDKKISFAHIFGADEKSSILSALKWNKLQKMLLAKIEKQTDMPFEKPKIDVKVKPKKIKKSISPAKEKKEVEEKPKVTVAAKVAVKENAFKSLEEKEPAVRVSGFTRDALKDLSSLPGMKKISNIDDKQVKEKKGGGLGTLATLGLVGVGLLGGGLLASITSIFNDGPFKGIQKAAGNIVANIGKMMTKTFAPFLEKQIANIFKGITKSLANLVGLFSRSAAASVLSIGKTASSGLLKVGSNFLKAILRKLPVVGTVIGLGSAISRIIKGDFVGGLLDITSAVSTLVPGVGTALSIAIDAFSAARDIKTGGAKKAGQAGINKSIGKFLTEKLDDIPIIGTFVRLSKAIGALSIGDWKMAGVYLTSVIPGMGWIFNKETIDKTIKGAPVKSFSQLILDVLKDRVRGILKKMPGFIKNPIYKMLGIKEEPEKKEEGIFNNIQTAKETKTKKNIKEQKVQDDTKKEIRRAKFEAEHPQLSKTEVKKIFDAEERRRESFYNRLQNENAKILKTKMESKPVANDFIWRKGQNVQRINPNDNIIATKNEKLFNKLTDALKNKKEDSKPNIQIVEQIHADITKLLRKMDGVMDTLISTAVQSKKTSTPPVRGELSGISDNAGDMRDPAYILRSRAWDRLRKGYVVL